MFTIRHNGSMLYYPGDALLDINTSNLIQEINLADSFRFSMFPQNPHYVTVERLTSIIEVWQNSKIIFRGRVINDSLDLFNERTIYCESVFAYFADTVVRPYVWQNGGPTDYLRMLVNQHNDQVGINKRFILGSVTVTDPNDYIYRAAGGHPSTMEEMLAKLPKLMGGFFRVDYNTDGTQTLNYLADTNLKSGQSITLGENLLSLVINSRSDEMATAIIPLGAKLETDSGVFPDFPGVQPPQITDMNGPVPILHEQPDGPIPYDIDGEIFDSPRLNIMSVNNGFDYLVNEDLVPKYGLIFKTVIFDDITQPLNLLVRGRAELAAASNPIQSLTLSAVDLSYSASNIDNFSFLEYVDIYSAPQSLEGRLLIVKMNTDLLNPSNSSITLGADWGRFTFGLVDMGNRVENIYLEVGNKEDIQYIFDSVRLLSTAITQTAESIRTEVNETFVTKNEFGTTTEVITTMFEQLNNQFNFTFTNIIDIINNNDGNIQNQFQEIQSYIRFIDGEIWLGRSDSEFQIRIGNERISFLDWGAEIAFVSNNQLFITTGQFLQTMNVGNFGFFPRPTGNLSFNKVINSSLSDYQMAGFFAIGTSEIDGSDIFGA